MKKKFKCHMFFIKADIYYKLSSFNINNPTYNDIDDSSLCLYAYTFSNVDAAEFKEMRNMDLFVYKTKKGSMKDKEQMKNEFGLCHLVDLSDINEDENSLLLTKEEYITIRSIGHRKITSLSWDFEPIPHILKNKYNMALSLLKYHVFSSERASEFASNCKIDYLSAFVINFGRLLK